MIVTVVVDLAKNLHIGKCTWDPLPDLGPKNEMESAVGGKLGDQSQIFSFKAIVQLQLTDQTSTHQAEESSSLALLRFDIFWEPMLLGREL